MSGEPVGLNPCSNGRCSARGYRCPQRDYVPAVLILVLMEDALRGPLEVVENPHTGSLNPCSNGRCSAS